MKNILILLSSLVLFLFIPSCEHNSQEPEIADQVYYLDENSEEGTFVGNVKAEDLDAEQLLTFEITGGNKNDAFMIEEETGNLFVNNPDVLDYEKNSRIDLLVTVNDNHPSEPLESSASIYVFLNNLNEYAPVIEAQSFSIEERSASGTVIGKIVATDADPDQILTFRIESGNENQVLLLDSLFGELSVRDSSWFNFDENQQLLCVVSVCDNDSISPLRSSATVTVDVIDVPFKIIDIEGFVQKGPFIAGSYITISELDSDLQPTGRVFSTSISDNSGRFILPDVDLESNYLNLRADGYYFNERTGNLSEAPLTLNCLVDVTDLESFNINVLSHLEKDRSITLMNDGMSFAEAKVQAKNDILEVFGFTSVEELHSEQLDIASSGEDNAILLAISVILQGNRTTGDFSELISQFSLDIREDGTLDNNSIGTALINGVNYANLEEIRHFIEQRYDVLGIEYVIPDFETYVNQFIEQTTFEATNQLIFPEFGTYGKNVLFPDIDTVEDNQLNDKYYSLAVEVPEGRSFSVKITGMGILYVWGSLINMDNYHENEPIPYALYTTTSSGLCDGKVGFFSDYRNPAGILTFEYFSENNVNPFFIKEVEILSDFAPVDSSLLK